MNDAAKLTTLCFFAAAMLSVSAPNLAQTTSKNSDGDDQLETIVVTAQKRAENLQTVPVSITVMDSKSLEQLGATQLADYAGYIPGLQMVGGGTPGQSTVSIRGIAPLGSSATVGTYIDDTPIGSSSLYGAGSVNTLDLLPYDFQSVDVLRGPQGTLYGASALGGLIKYVTRAPDLNNWGLEVGTDTFFVDDSDKPGIGGRIRVNAPLIPGELGMSASFSRENTPGYINNVVTGNTYQNAYYQQAARVALLWTPSEDFSVNVSAINQQINANSTSYVALSVTGQPLYGKLTNDNNMPETYTNLLNYFSASVNWNLGWADFVSGTSYSQSKIQPTIDATLIYGVAIPLFGFPPGISQFIDTLSLYKTTQEFRLASKPSDRFEWMVGAFYDYENSDQNEVVTAQSTDGAPIPEITPFGIVGLPSTYKEYAGFGNATYKFNSWFDISGGVRYAHNSQDFIQESAGVIVAPGSVSGNSAQGTWTYSVGPQFQINPDTMAYARVATGYQPGGPNVVLPGVPPQVNSDTVTNYEIGLKTEFDEHRVLVDVAAFLITWHDIQVGATTAGGFGYLVNGGTAKSEGLEFTSVYRPITNLRLGLNFAYTQATLTQDIPSIGGVDGDTLPNIPKWAGSGTVDYSMPLSNNWTARVGGGVRFTGATETSVVGNPTAFPLDSYTVVDLNAGVTNEHWNVRFFAKNVANKQVYVNETAESDALTGAVVQLRGVPLQPRTVGIALDLKY